MTSDPGWQQPEDPAGRPATARLVDPEDDLGSPGYGQAWAREHVHNQFAGGYPADGETTRIPPLAPPSGPPSTAYGLISNAEPLPYVQPPVETSHPAPVEIVAVDPEVKAAGRRGTQDLGLLVLRLALGVAFIAHGLQKVFGWWGGEGLDGFKTALTQAGYQHAELLTYLGAGVQITAGVLLVLGLFTPVAAAAALGFLVNGLFVEFATQRKNGALAIFGTGDTTGAEYLLMLTGLAAAVILCGPGRYGFDGGRGWARRPFIGSIVALLLGAGGGVAAWYLLHGTNPFA